MTLGLQEFQKSPMGCSRRFQKVSLRSVLKSDRTFRFLQPTLFLLVSLWFLALRLWSLSYLCVSASTWSKTVKKFVKNCKLCKDGQKFHQQSTKHVAVFCQQSTQNDAQVVPRALGRGVFRFRPRSTKYIEKVIWTATQGATFVVFCGG